ncbi:MAG TPA: hypothetical protein VFZ65_01015 [Planctomycetota bacterium]|nr:hypothetical protein [Planctomycetota bacterium]
MLAPDDEPRKIPTRRAFLMAGTTFVLGSSLGGACGYALGAAQSQEAKEPAAESAPKVEPKAEEELKPSGDSDLDELRRLAVKAPIEELVELRMTFLHFQSTVYRKDAVLWRGFERLCDVLLRDPAFPDRKIIAHTMAQTIELASPEVREAQATRLRELRSIK